MWTYTHMSSAAETSMDCLRLKASLHLWGGVDYCSPASLSRLLRKTAFQYQKINSTRFCTLHWTGKKDTKLYTELTPELAVSWRLWVLAYSRYRPNFSCLSAISKTVNLEVSFRRQKPFDDQVCQFSRKKAKPEQQKPFKANDYVWERAYPFHFRCISWKVDPWPRRCACSGFTVSLSVLRDSSRVICRVSATDVHKGGVRVDCTAQKGPPV